MKVNIQKIVYRVIPFVVALVVVFACCITGFIVASAEVYSYEDYVVRVSVDGENDLCVVQLPENFYRMTAVVYGEDDEHNDYPVTFTSSGESFLDLVWHPNFYYIDFSVDLGGNNNYLNVMNIPNDSILEFRINADFDGDDWYGDPIVGKPTTITSEIRYYDSVYNQLVSNYKTYTSNLTFQGANRFRIPFSKPGDAYCCVPSLTWNKVNFPNNTTALLRWEMVTCQLVFTISSAYREAGVSGEYGELIVAITEQLAKNQASSEEFYDYMEKDMGVTHEQLDDIMEEMVSSNDKLGNLEVQNATIIKGQETVIDQQDQMIQGQEQIIEQNGQIIEQNETIIVGDEESQEALNWVDAFVQNSLNKAQDTLDDLETEKVEIDPDDFALDSFVNGQDMNLYFSFAQGVFANDTFATMCVACVSLVIVSFVFFGKK